MAVIECAGCGTRADDAWTVCPGCGANPAAGAVEASFMAAPVPAGAKKKDWSRWALLAALVAIAAVCLPLPGLFPVALVAWPLALVWGVMGCVRYRSGYAIVALALWTVPVVYLTILLVTVNA